MLPEIFNYRETQIRVVMVNGEPWWIAADVCAILELQNPTMALKRLDSWTKLP